MNINPDTRRANLWTMIALAIFAVGLCVAVFLWMRHLTAQQGGIVYPPATILLSAGSFSNRLSYSNIL